MTHGRTLLVTGGSRGIGAAIARRAARAGYRVLINWHSNGDAARAVAGDIERAGGEAACLQADIGDEAQIMRMFEAIDGRYGTLDALVNNAGLSSHMSVRETDAATLARLLQVNVFGLMMSLNMLIETGEGFDYSFADFNKWASQVGFSSTSLMPLAGPSSAAIAYK